jgi:uncharacterized protein YndB with AHSA1/START domain
MNDDYEARLTLAATPDDVFNALTTQEGLSGWWTSVAGSGLTGGELTFTFGPGSHAVMRVDAAERGVAVRWTNVACVMDDWVGTSMHFELQATPSGGTELRFRHVGLTPRLECYTDCKRGWDHFIPTSLRDYVETGAGHPNGSAADLARREAREQQRAAAHVG